MNIDQLLNDLLIYGGTIVASDSVSDKELENAKEGGRFGTDGEGTGYVRRELEARKAMEAALAKSFLRSGANLYVILTLSSDPIITGAFFSDEPITELAGREKEIAEFLGIHWSEDMFVRSMGELKTLPSPLRFLVDGI